MLKGRIEEIKNIELLSNETKAEIETLFFGNKLQSLACGVYPMKGENKLIITAFEPEQEDGLFEVHKVYLDIHIGLSNNEYVRWVDIQHATNSTDYNAEDDYQLFEAVESEKIALKEDEFVLFTPQDVHRCGMSFSKKNFIKKAIFKIKI